MGWGGQVVISDALRGLIEHDLPEGVAIRSLGVHRLRSDSPRAPVRPGDRGTPLRVPTAPEPRGSHQPADPAHLVRGQGRRDRPDDGAPRGEPAHHADRLGRNRARRGSASRSLRPRRPNSLMVSSSWTCRPCLIRCWCSRRSPLRCGCGRKGGSDRCTRSSRTTLENGRCCRPRQLRAGARRRGRDPSPAGDLCTIQDRRDEQEPAARARGAVPCRWRRCPYLTPAARCTSTTRAAARQ